MSTSPRLFWARICEKKFRFRLRNLREIFIFGDIMNALYADHRDVRLGRGTIGIIFRNVPSPPQSRPGCHDRQNECKLPRRCLLKVCGMALAAGPSFGHLKSPQTSATNGISHSLEAVLASLNVGCCRGVELSGAIATLVVAMLLGH